MASAVASIPPVSTLELSDLQLERCVIPTSATDVRLRSPSAKSVKLARVPLIVHADRPFEIFFAAVEFGAGADEAASVARWISTHALLTVDINKKNRTAHLFSVYAYPTDGGCIVRALARPSAWADASSVTVVSLSLAGRPQLCECLPATLRVGYNHAPEPVGAVYDAAEAGDVPELQAALEDGGSTEEADGVRRGGERTL